MSRAKKKKKTCIPTNVICTDVNDRTAPSFSFSSFAGCDVCVSVIMCYDTCVCVCIDFLVARHFPRKCLIIATVVVADDAGISAHFPKRPCMNEEDSSKSSSSPSPSLSLAKIVIHI